MDFILPPAVLSALSAAPAVAFSGSRSVAPPAPLLRAVVSACPPAAAFAVGCAPGADEAFRAALPSFELFAVSSGAFGVGRSAFARRSVALCSWAAARGGLFVSFPAAPCPPGLFPSPSSSRCFCGSGSGSWASLAFAAGSGASCLLWLPPGPGRAAPPASWGFSSFGEGWRFLPASQLSLF